jgi:hypothetical protein
MAGPRFGLECRGPRDGNPVARSALGKRLLWHTAAERAATRGPQVQRIDPEPVDALLLCTEGLMRHVPNLALADALAAPIPLGCGAQTGRRAPRARS